MCSMTCSAQLLAGGDQHGRRVGAVLGLGQQVDGDDERVGVLVGDDQHFGRPGEEVDADLAEQLALGLGDVGVAGAGEHVDRVDGLGADGQGGDRLDTAEQVDLVGAGQVHGGDGGVRGPHRGSAACRRRRARRRRPSR